MIRTLLLALTFALAAPPGPVVAQSGHATATAEAAGRSQPWPEAEPAEAGMDAALLDQAGERADVELPDISAIVVARGGTLVYERYYGDQEVDEPINVRSVTKSVVSTLIGIALADGDLESLDQTIGDLIPDRIPDGADPRTPDITVRGLLTMTSGLAWSAYSDYPDLIASDDWVTLTLGQPVVADQGTTYVYNSGGSHLLSVILTEVTGQDTAEYAQERLFGPLGIVPGEWERSPQGEAIGGFGLHLTARDMAKLGQLYLDEGRWDGEQIVPASYVAEAITYQSAGDSTGGVPYGYQWWVTDVYGYPVAFALGYGGQFIYLVPDLDLVVVAGIARRVPPEELVSPRPIIEQLIVAAALVDA